MGVILRGCRSIITNSSRPSFSRASWAGLEGLPASAVHRLGLKSFICQHLLGRERRRAVSSLMLGCEGFEKPMRVLR